MKTQTKNLGEELYKNKETILLLSIIWIVLFEQFSVFTITSGILVSVFVVLFTDHFLLDKNYGYSYSIEIGTLIKYFGRLLYSIIVSGFQALPIVLSGKANVQIVTTKTELKSELLINLLVNCISITPGSLAINKNGNELQVLTFNPPGKGENLREVLPLEMESLLKEYEERSGNRYHSEE